VPDIGLESSVRSVMRLRRIRGSGGWEPRIVGSVMYDEDPVYVPVKVPDPV